MNSQEKHLFCRISFFLSSETLKSSNELFFVERGIEVVEQIFIFIELACFCRTDPRSCRAILSFGRIDPRSYRAILSFGRTDPLSYRIDPSFWLVDLYFYRVDLHFCRADPYFCRVDLYFCRAQLGKSLLKTVVYWDFFVPIDLYSLNSFL